MRHKNTITNKCLCVLYWHVHHIIQYVSEKMGYCDTLTSRTLCIAWFLIVLLRQRIMSVKVACLLSKCSSVKCLKKKHVKGQFSGLCIIETLLALEILIHAIEYSS